MVPVLFISAVQRDVELLGVVAYVVPLRTALESSVHNVRSRNRNELAGPKLQSEIKPVDCLRTQNDALNAPKEPPGRRNCGSRNCSLRHESGLPSMSELEATGTL